MIIHYLKNSIRNLLRNKMGTLLNIFGLSIGISGALLIGVYVYDDLRWDSFHHNLDKIFIVTDTESFQGGGTGTSCYTMGPLVEKINEEIAQVETASRVIRCKSILFKTDSESIYESKVYSVDPGFFQIFDFDLIYGEQTPELTNPDDIIISEELAEKLFGEINPVGEIIETGRNEGLRIVGVVRVPEFRSSIRFNVLRPVSAAIAEGRVIDQWNWLNVNTYVLLKDTIDIEQVNKILNEIMSQNIEDGEADLLELFPFKNIHLKSGNINFDLNSSVSDIYYTLSFAAIGIFLLIIAAINYINMTTAKSLQRAREVGLRKVIGASKISILFQFMIESIIITLSALILAFLISELFAPQIESLAGRPVILDFSNIPFMLSTIIATCFFSFLTSLYPSYVLAAFRPSSVLKGQADSGPGGSRLRRILVMLQFAITIILLMLTTTVHRQLSFMTNSKSGMNPENMMLLRLRDIDTEKYASTIRDQLSALPEVSEAGLSANFIGFSGVYLTIEPEGLDGEWAMDFVWMDDNCLKAYEFEVVQGRLYSQEFPGDNQWLENNKGSILINESAAKALGWENPIGKKINIAHGEATIVGVIKDFHNKSLHTSIAPTIIHYAPDYINFANIRYNTDNVALLLEKINGIYSEYANGYPMRTYFLEEEYKTGLYGNELSLMRLMRVFTIIAIIIACLGLIGLTAYSTERRRKEIAVRKVLGARVDQVIMLLTREFSIVVIVSNLIAWPVSLLLMNKWLENFAYKSDLNFWIFPVTGLFALLISVLVTSMMAYKASVENPASILRSDS